MLIRNQIISIKNRFNNNIIYWTCKSRGCNVSISTIVNINDIHQEIDKREEQNNAQYLVNYKLKKINDMKNAL